MKVRAIFNTSNEILGVLEEPDDDFLVWLHVAEPDIGISQEYETESVWDFMENWFARIHA